MDFEMSFVVRNLQTGEDSNWIELDSMTREQAQAEWDRIVDPMFDFEVVDFEDSLGLRYRDYQYASFEKIYKDFETLDRLTAEGVDILIVKKLIDDEGVSVEDLSANMDRTVFADVGGNPEDLGRAVFREFGLQAITNPESYFDYESFGEDLIAGGFLEEMENEDPEIVSMFEGLDVEELAEKYISEVYGSVEDLPEGFIRTHFDYYGFGKDLAYEYTHIRVNGLEGWVSDN